MQNEIYRVVNLDNPHLDPQIMTSSQTSAENTVLEFHNRGDFGYEVWGRLPDSDEYVFMRLVEYWDIVA